MLSRTISGRRAGSEKGSNRKIRFADFLRVAE
jgi:hypothetical protein